MSNRQLLMGASLLLTLFVWQSMLGTMALAVGFLVMIFIHEMGHYLAAKQLGLPVSAPIFTPMGAVILMPTLPKSAKDEAYIAMGRSGPRNGWRAGRLHSRTHSGSQGPDPSLATRLHVELVQPDSARSNGRRTHLDGD